MFSILPTLTGTPAYVALLAAKALAALGFMIAANVVILYACSAARLVPLFARPAVPSLPVALYGEPAADQAVAARVVADLSRPSQRHADRAGGAADLFARLPLDSFPAR